MTLAPSVTPGNAPSDAPSGPSGRAALIRDRRLWEVIALLSLLAVAVMLRVYRLPELMLLGNDQGRDAMVVAHFLRTGDPILQGLPASTGYHRGPAYLYILALAYWLGGLQPISGALLTVVAEVLGMIMAWVIGRAVAGPVAGLTAVALWVVSPILLYFGGSQWNPQLIPFLALLCLYATWRVVEGDARWFAVLAPAWLVGWQVHDQMLLLLPALAIALLIYRPRVGLRWFVIGGALGLVVMAPFIVWQLGNRFVDVRGIANVLLGRTPPVGGSVPLPERPTAILGTLLRALPDVALVRLLLDVMALVGLAWLVVGLRDRPSKISVILLLYALTPLAYLLWPAPFFAHYLMLIYPVPLLLIGVAVARIVEAVARIAPRSLAAAAAAVLLGVLVVSQAVGAMEARSQVVPSGRRWDNRLAVVREAAAAAGSPFTFRLVSDQEPFDGWRDPWRYAFLIAGAEPSTTRVDLPTVVVFDPADFGGGVAWGGTVRDDVRWVVLDPPALGDDLVVNGRFDQIGDDPVPGWQLTEPGSGTVETGADGPALRLVSPRVVDGVNATQDLALRPGRRYEVRFEHRSELAAGEPRVYLQLLDASGRVVSTAPDGGGYVAPRSDTWTPGSFLVDVPGDAVTGRLWLRDRGAGAAWFRDIEVLEVVGQRALP